MKRALVFLVGLALVACQDHHPVAPPDAPDFAIRDARVPGGNPGFYFLAPIRRLVDDATVPRTGFNGTLSPVIEVWECSITAGCGSLTGPIYTITKTSGTALLNRLYVLPTFREYNALWDTKSLGLDPNRTYRIKVRVGGQELGYADVDIVRTLRELAGVNRDEFVPLLQNFILPIRFWIGNNALCSVTCSSKTIILAEGGTVELVTPLEHFTFDIPATTTATSGTAAVTDVTFTLQTCSGVEVDLPKFGQCLRVTTRYSGIGINALLTLSNPAKVSMCVLEPGIPVDQEKLVTLHQQDGTLIRALPHAPACPRLTLRESESRGLAGRSWHWVRDFAGTLFTPRPLYAGSRTALFNLGGGGQTHALGLPPCSSLSSASRIPGMALVTCIPLSAPLMAPPSPSSGNTISDFQFALPAKINYLDSETDPDRSAWAGTAIVYKVSATDARYANITDAVSGVTTGGFLKFTITEGDITLPTVTVPVVGGFAQITRTLAAGTTTVVASGVGFATPAVNGPLGTFDPFWPDYDVTAIAGSTVTLLPATLVFHTTGLSPTLAFETYPGGAAACSRCDVTNQFHAQGADFAYESFDHVFTGGTLGDGNGVLYGDAGNLSNHFITSALTAIGQGISGYLTMSLQSPYPRTVRFELSSARDINPPLNVFDGAGTLVPAAQITRTFLRNYTSSAGAAFSWTTVEVTSATGIQRVVFDMNNYVQQIDNVVLTP
jgi:hypothetical protein